MPASVLLRSARWGSITKCYLHKLTGLLPILMLEILFSSVYLCSLQTEIVLTLVLKWLFLSNLAKISYFILWFIWTHCNVFWAGIGNCGWCVLSVITRHHCHGGGSAQTAPEKSMHTSHDITHNTLHTTHYTTQTYKHTPITNICQSGHCPPPH